VANNFTLGVQVTLIGMALVFLTLIIIMFAIMLLDRLFRPKVETAKAAPAEERAVALVRPVAGAGLLSVQPADGNDEVAAIGLALARAMASRAAMSAAALSPAARAAVPAVVFPWDKPRASDTTPMGDVVTVVNIDSGSAVWRSQGRLKAVERR